MKTYNYTKKDLKIIDNFMIAPNGKALLIHSYNNEVYFTNKNIWRHETTSVSHDDLKQHFLNNIQFAEFNQRYLDMYNKGYDINKNKY